MRQTNGIKNKNTQRQEYSVSNKNRTFGPLTQSIFGVFLQAYPEVSVALVTSLKSLWDFELDLGLLHKISSVSNTSL